MVFFVYFSQLFVCFLFPLFFLGSGSTQIMSNHPSFQTPVNVHGRPFTASAFLNRPQSAVSSATLSVGPAGLMRPVTPGMFLFNWCLLLPFGNCCS
jgi:hypothetical protein